SPRLWGFPQALGSGFGVPQDLGSGFGVPHDLGSGFGVPQALGSGFGVPPDFGGSPGFGVRIWGFPRIWGQDLGFPQDLGSGFGDMEVSPTELMNILNRVVTRQLGDPPKIPRDPPQNPPCPPPDPDLKTDGFGLDTCRSMVAVMDVPRNFGLGFEEFKYLWNNIKKWQCVYKQFDTDRSGTIGPQELPGAFEAAGFRLPPPLWAVLGRRYGDEGGNLDFDNFISCLVRLDAMFQLLKFGGIQNWGGIPEFQGKNPGEIVKFRGNPKIWGRIAFEIGEKPKIRRRPQIRGKTKIREEIAKFTEEILKFGGGNC
uniref:Uncharacterized protein n=1 Tax=Geospiza parvula TaxID=87175 RepID=A0A8U8B433_GEOPR